MKKLFAAALATTAVALSGCTPATSQSGATPAPAPSASTASTPSSEEFANQVKIDEYIQGCIQYNWEGGNIKEGEKKVFKGITLSGKYDMVEDCFTEARKLDENRLDLHFGIATAQIAQKEFDDALATYRGIIELYPESVQANALLAGYLRAMGKQDEEYNKAMEQLKKIDPDTDYNALFDRTDAVFNTKFNTEAFKMDKPDSAIVVLGYALGKDGKMEDTLLHRLEQALAMAKLNAEAKIIVSGGVPKGGLTEAYVMKKWLMDNGIEADRIIAEDQAKDTVDNAYYSVKQLQQIGAKNVTLITSGTHMHRGLVTLAEAAKLAGLQLDSIDNLIYLDKPTVEEAQAEQENEKIFVYRDMLRSAGFWAYPGIHR